LRVNWQNLRPVAQEPGGFDSAELNVDHKGSTSAMKVAESRGALSLIHVVDFEVVDNRGGRGNSRGIFYSGMTKVFTHENIRRKFATQRSTR
jgi:hypothetical protein